MAYRGKKYKEAVAKVEAGRQYNPQEAVSLVKDTSYAKFDATVEVHVRLGVDPRQADEQVRDVVVLPHGLGKQIKVLVFAQGDAARAAREAGADVVADDDAILKKIEGGWLDFDVAIATPDMMGTVGRLGRVLGPRGLMPNPKAGTVANEKDLGRAITQAKAGRVEFRLDKTGNLHVAIGKVSFQPKQLEENFATLMEAIVKAKPPGAKGVYIRSLTLCATMGPAVRIDPLTAQSMDVEE